MSLRHKRALLTVMIMWGFFAAHSVFAAVAFDAYTQATAGTGNLSWTHTPVGTPKAVIVLCHGGGTTDEFTSVTYGGTSVPSVSQRTETGGEGGDVEAFFLGSSIPTGNQTVSVTVSGTGTKECGAVTLTASANTEVVDSDNTINSTSLANPSVTLGLNNRTSFAALTFYTGQNTVSTACTPFASWTSRVETDFGTDGGGIYTFDTIGNSDVTAGFTQAAEDAVMVALAVSEVLSGSAPTVTTGYESNVGATTAYLYGTISSDGGNSIVTYGFATSTSATLATGVSTSSFGSITAPTVVATTSKGHSANTQYFFRFYATNAVGTSYGAIHFYTTGNTTVSRRIRLFEGYRIKFLNGKMYLQPR